MGDDMNLDMSGVKIFMDGQELKTVKEITIPHDVELSGDLPKGHINAFPDEVYGTIKFKKKSRLRWRNIKKAYKLMGCNKIAALLKILKDHFVEDTDKDSHVIYEWPSNIGKSDSMPGKIVGITR